MNKEEEIVNILEKLRKLGTEELMYVSGAASALFSIQQKDIEKNKEQNSLSNAL